MLDAKLTEPSVIKDHPVSVEMRSIIIDGKVSKCVCIAVEFSINVLHNNRSCMWGAAQRIQNLYCTHVNTKQMGTATSPNALQLARNE